MAGDIIGVFAALTPNLKTYTIVTTANVSNDDMIRHTSATAVFGIGLIQDLQHLGKFLSVSLKNNLKLFFFF